MYVYNEDYDIAYPDEMFDDPESQPGYVPDHGSDLDGDSGSGPEDNKPRVEEPDKNINGKTSGSAPEPDIKFYWDGAVKSITFFNPDGTKRMTNEFNRDGSVKSHTTYNSDGTINSLTSFNREGTDYITTRYSYVYDKDKRTTTSITRGKKRKYYK